MVYIASRTVYRVGCVIDITSRWVSEGRVLQASCSCNARAATIVTANVSHQCRVKESAGHKLGEAITRQ